MALVAGAPADDVYRVPRVSMASALAHGIWSFLKHYIFKLGFIDGWAGFVIAFGNFEGTFYRYAKRYEEAQGWQPPACKPVNHKPWNYCVTAISRLLMPRSPYRESRPLLPIGHSKASQADSALLISRCQPPARIKFAENDPLGQAIYAAKIKPLRELLERVTDGPLVTSGRARKPVAHDYPF